MNFFKLAKERYSCRNFDTTKPIEQEKIDKILEAAKFAPTAVNFQPQRILILQDQEKLSKLSECTNYGWGAPLVMLVGYDKNVSWKRKYDGKDEGIVDASIVATHMMFEISELGLGTTWVGYFNPEKLKEIYSIPDNIEIIAILPIGYPSEDAIPAPHHEKRNDVSSFVYYNEFK